MHGQIQAVYVLAFILYVFAVMYVGARYACLIPRMPEEGLRSLALSHSSGN